VLCCLCGTVKTPSRIPHGALTRCTQCTAQQLSTKLSTKLSRYCPGTPKARSQDALNALPSNCRATVNETVKVLSRNSQGALTRRTQCTAKQRSRNRNLQDAQKVNSTHCQATAKQVLKNCQGTVKELSRRTDQTHSMQWRAIVKRTVKPLSIHCQGPPKEPSRRAHKMHSVHCQATAEQLSKKLSRHCPGTPNARSQDAPNALPSKCQRHCQGTVKELSRRAHNCTRRTQ